MSPLFAELASETTPMGIISLRRRREPVLDGDAYEVKLDVVVGGLGLGYTARAALEDPRVASLTGGGPPRSSSPTVRHGADPGDRARGPSPGPGQEMTLREPPPSVAVVERSAAL